MTGDLVWVVTAWTLEDASWIDSVHADQAAAEARVTRLRDRAAERVKFTGPSTFGCVEMMVGEVDDEPSPAPPTTELEPAGVPTIDLTCLECRERGKGTYAVVSECRNCDQWHGIVIRSEGHAGGYPYPECPACGCRSVHRARDGERPS